MLHILYNNNAGLQSLTFSRKATTKNYRHRQPHLRLTPLPEEPSEYPHIPYNAVSRNELLAYILTLTVGLINILISSITCTFIGVVFLVLIVIVYFFLFLLSVLLMNKDVYILVT